ncbi:unnamed protein product [Schistosoma mansoni]|uniref:Smp_204780 n=1 Tax=Schistosoma mansoni TaxID=6183 RepID=UPI00022C87CF|nr:unnamed protein product [Schistosoma mansoni]|eukprot:XP_018646653.1 unnamed protein product [Schistosoma mansoni]
MYKPLFLTKDKNQDYEVMEGILAYCIPLIREPRWIDKTLRLAIRVFGQMVIDKIDLNELVVRGFHIQVTRSNKRNLINFEDIKSIQCCMHMNQSVCLLV